MRGSGEEVVEVECSYCLERINKIGKTLKLDHPNFEANIEKKMC
jgi:hypothetical protein